jgi:methenyltetrahydromethanopterin cyclohydrolase
MGDPKMMSKTSRDDSEKLSRHLTLLREEYVKLQSRYTEIEKKYNVLVASRGDQPEQDTFVSRLLKTVANLFEQELYSDLTIALRQSTIKAHKFILSSRSDEWGVMNLNDVGELDWRDIKEEIGYALLKWVYTDNIQVTGKDDDFVLGNYTLSASAP